MDKALDDIRALKNVLRVPRLTEMYQKKMQTIKDQQKLNEMHTSKLTKDTAKMNDKDLMEDLKIALRLQLGKDPNLSQFMNNTS